MKLSINGIQQLGVGVVNIQEAFGWYRIYFGMDIKMFDEAAMAELMLPHTEGEARRRHAILALNLQGGGGFEVWQHTGKKPEPPKFEVELGDLGIAVGKLKSTNVKNTYDQYKKWKLNILTGVTIDPRGREHFYLKDVYGNLWEVCHDDYLLKSQKSANGGVYGVTIGVSDMEKSLTVYSKLLKYDTIVYDVTGVFQDWEGVPGSGKKFRRLLLRPSVQPSGAFSPLLGPSCIELVQQMEGETRQIYEGRIWGDPGFIHICFDINGMDDLRQQANASGFPFTVDSAKDTDTFGMGEAAGSFAYIQAPEGTLIEFVETHKIPLMRKLNWYLDLTRRKPGPLPKWMFELFAFMRVK
ncbi:MAG: VOC family protein [Lentimicrobiaceae bacterium]|nr:VOC family protein [Lentimicrobiaceae bacterium]